MKAIEKWISRLEVLEGKHVPKGDQWPPLYCDPFRRLKRYIAYFEGQPWECTGSPERKAERDARLAEYKAYFDSLEAQG